MELLNKRTQSTNLQPEVLSWWLRLSTWLNPPPPTFWLYIHSKAVLASGLHTNLSVCWEHPFCKATKACTPGILNIPSQIHQKQEALFDDYSADCFMECVKFCLHPVRLFYASRRVPFSLFWCVRYRCILKLMTYLNLFF